MGTAYRLCPNLPPPLPPVQWILDALQQQAPFAAGASSTAPLSLLDQRPSHLLRASPASFVMSPNPKSRARRKRKHAKKAVTASALEDATQGMGASTEEEDGVAGVDGDPLAGADLQVSLTTAAVERLALASAGAPNTDTDASSDRVDPITTRGDASSNRVDPITTRGDASSNRLVISAPKSARLSPRQRLRRAGFHPRAPKPGSPTSGTVPNLHYCVLRTEELRVRPEYFALPPVEQMALGHPSSYRFVRQDTHMWDALHQGRLTCSKLAASLGFYEPMASKALRLPKSWVSHAPLVSAYYHLLDPLLVPDGELHRRFGREEEAAHNQAIVDAYNGDARCRLPSSQPSISTLQGTVDLQDGHPAGVTDGGTRHGSGAGGAPTAADLPGKKGSAAIGRGHKSHGQAPPPSRLSKEEEKRRGNISSSVAARGISSVRMAWGSAQEAASLFALAKHVEGGSVRVEEVGLCIVDVEKDVPKDWGIQAHLLPPLGASPDGLLRHWEPLSAASNQGDTMTAGPIHAVIHPFLGVDGLVGNGPPANGTNATSSPALDSNGHIVEVIEVKNRCPFQHEETSRRSGTKKTSKPHYAVSDADPPTDSVHPTYVPQLQMEMLAAKASSAVLVLNTATKGMYLFRMHRNDEYLRLLLHFISLFYTRHVLKGVPPPNNIFTDNKEYHKLLKLTCSLARSITFLERVEEPACVSTCCDHRLFLEA
eukprot:jgi/Mesvir1/3884/Mv19836-RA.1